MKVYLDFRDWWVGYYRGDEHHFVCLVPTLVIRWNRKKPSYREEVVKADPLAYWPLDDR